MRALDAQLYPEKLKAIAQQVQDQQAQTQSLVHLQQHKQLERDHTPAHSPQVGSIYTKPDSHINSGILFRIMLRC